MPLCESAVGELASLLCVLYAGIVILVGWVLWLRRKLRKLEYALDEDRAWWAMEMMAQNSTGERVERLEQELKSVLQQAGLKSLLEIESDRAWADVLADQAKQRAQWEEAERVEEQSEDTARLQADEDDFGREDGFWFQTRGY